MAQHLEAAELPDRRALRPEHLYKFAGLLFLFALLYRFFTEITTVLLVAFAAAILAIAFNALVRHAPGDRKWATGLLGIVVLAGLGAALWFGVPILVQQVRSFAQNGPALESRLSEVSTWVRQNTGLSVELMGQRLRGYLEQFFGGLSGNQVIGQARGLLEVVLLPLLIFFGALYAVGKPNDRLLLPVLRAIPEDRRPAFRHMFELLGTRLLAWVKGTLLSMLIIGVLSTAAFYLIGLNYALMLGVWSGLTEFVPIVGPFVGGITAVIVAFLEDPQKALWTLLAVFAIQQLESNLITPIVMAKVADVHPFVTLFAILLFGSLFGFLGVLLALPLVLFFWTVVQVLWVERAIHTGDDRIPPIVDE